MKKIIVLLLLMIFFVLLASCSDEEPVGSDQSGSEEDNEVDIEKLEGELKYQYNMDDYISLPKLEGQKIEIELDDIQKQIDSYILDYAKKTNRTICMIGDVVDVSYIGYMLDENGKILNEGGKTVVFDERESYGIYLGSSLAHKELENGILGMSVGEQRDIYITMPSDYSKSELAGKRVLFDVQLSGIFEPAIYNDKFVSENFEEYKTTEELEKAILMERIYNFIREKAEVKKYPEKEYSALANELKEAEESFKKQNGISLDEYIENRFGMTREEYIKNEIKYTMVIYALAQKEKFIPTDDELVSEKKELVAYYTSYYKNKGMNDKDALKNANDVVNDLGKSYLYENVISQKLDQRLPTLVEIEKKPTTYKSVTVSLVERANGESGKELGKLLPSFDLEVFDERGALGTTLNPGRNVGKITVVYFWNNKNIAQTDALKLLDKLAKEYADKVTVYAIHSTESYGSAADYLMENLADSEIVFLRDYTENGNDAIKSLLGDKNTDTYALIVDKDGVIKTTPINMRSYEKLVMEVEGLEK